MRFQEILNEYMKQLCCSGKELAEASGLSSSLISRYRSGERLPARNRDSLNRLAAGLSKLSKQTQIPLSVSDILKKLNDSLQDSQPESSLCFENLNILLEALEISSGELAKFLNYDTSHISRIRTGQRSPGNPEAFADGVCRFIVRKCRSRENHIQIAALLGCEPQEVMESPALYNRLKGWLFDGRCAKEEPISGFLSTLDSFDLKEYIRAIRFDDIKIPCLPFQLPISKYYRGIEEMKTGELDFLKAAVLSHSAEPVFMCSDMPMEDMAQDLDFSKKWILGITAMLKKGLHLNIVHNLNRPFTEMMLGLESWIPLYMTGLISPYYFSSAQNQIYSHFLYVSGIAALSGECVSGCHAHGQYYLTKNREELKYYRQRAGDLLEKALPLMEIYRKDSSDNFYAFLRKDAVTAGARREIFSAPPIYTISDQLLTRILERNSIEPEQVRMIFSYVHRCRQFTAQILSVGTISHRLHEMSREEFSRCPVSLSLSGAFYEADIPYTYEEYHEGKWAMVSKSGSPVIHFIIRHPRLRSALENMILPVMEG